MDAWWDEKGSMEKLELTEDGSVGGTDISGKRQELEYQGY